MPLDGDADAGDVAGDGQGEQVGDYTKQPDAGSSELCRDFPESESKRV
jgi:hypothetical protein